jgi:hypothetical protein
MAGKRKVDESMDEAGAHPAESQQSELQKAYRLFNKAHDELEEAHTEQKEAYKRLQSVRTQYEQAYDNGDDTAPLQFHLQQAERRYEQADRRYEQAKERYQEAKERYRELKEELGKEGTEAWMGARTLPLLLVPVYGEPMHYILLFIAGAPASSLRATCIKRSGFEPLTLDALKRSVNTIVDIPLVARVLNTSGIEGVPEKVFLRQEYVEFLDEWLQCKHKGKILLGSPGIGKSVCLYLVLEYLLREPQYVVMWVWDMGRRSNNELGACVGWGDDIYVTDFGTAAAKFSSRDAIFVYDGRSNLHYMSPPPFSRGLVAHSPSAESIAGTEKEGFRRWYMNPWTGEEIRDWAVHEGYDTQLALKLYNIVGGVLRDVQSALEEGSEKCTEHARARVREAVKEVFPAETDEPVAQGAGKQAAVHRILHWYPEDDARMQRQTFYSSPYARDQFLERMNELNSNEFLLRPRLGSQFENAVLGHMEKKNHCHFRVRVLEDTVYGHMPQSQKKTLRKKYLKRYKDAKELVRAAS